MLKAFRSTIGAVFDALSGIGSSEDPGKRFYFTTDIENFSEAEIISAYTKSGMVQKLVELIPNKANKAVYELPEPVLEVFKQYKIIKLFNEASISARLFKESYIILNTDIGSTDEPLEPNASLVDLYAVERDQLTFDVDEFQNRPMYYLRLKDQKKLPIHPSRVLLFVGKFLPRKVRASNKSYHGSIIGGLMSSYGVVSHATNISLSLMARMATFVFKMAGLQSYIEDNQNGEDMILRRLNLHRKGIGSVGGLVIDADSEEVEWLNLNVSGVSELVKMQREQLTADSELTHALLWNVGSHETASDTEQRNFADKINEFLELHWQENFNIVHRLVCNRVGVAYKETKLDYIYELQTEENNQDNQSKQDNQNKKDAPENKPSAS